MLLVGTKDATPESLLQREADRLEQLYWAKVKDGPTGHSKVGRGHVSQGVCCIGPKRVSLDPIC